MTELQASAEQSDRLHVAIIAGQCGVPIQTTTLGPDHPA